MSSFFNRLTLVSCRLWLVLAFGTKLATPGCSNGAGDLRLGSAKYVYSVPSFSSVERPIGASACVGDSSNGIGILFVLSRCVFIEVAVLFSTQRALPTFPHAPPVVYSVKTSAGIGNNLSAATFRKFPSRAPAKSGSIRRQDCGALAWRFPFGKETVGADVRRRRTRMRSLSAFP